MIDIREHGGAFGGSGGIVKSVQRGELHPTSDSDVAINAIEPNKSILILSQIGEAAQFSILPVKGKITSPTNLNFATFSTAPTANSPTVYWEVIEFTNVKSKQSGELRLTSTSGSVDINAVDMFKTMIFTSNNAESSGTHTIQRFPVGAKLLNQTTLEFHQNSSTPRNIAWQVLEFN